MSAAQPDLFGEYDAELQAADARRRERAEWAAHFRHVPVTIAYEASIGKPGDVLDGIACPACGGIEFNGFLLGINHGWDPGAPKRDLYGRPAFETCSKLWLRSRGRDDVSLDGGGVVRLSPVGGAA